MIRIRTDSRPRRWAEARPAARPASEAPLGIRPSAESLEDRQLLAVTLDQRAAP